MDFQCAAHHVALEAQLWTVFRVSLADCSSKSPISAVF